MEKKPKLAFVCTGNTCRSPMAQFILKQKLKKTPEISLFVTSFGTNAVEEEINPLAKSALKSLKISMTKFTPKTLTLKKGKDYSALVAMTDGIKYHLEKEGYVNVYSVNQLTSLGDIQDPYGGSEEDYLSCAKKIYEACDMLVAMLKEILL